jgi:DNA-binding GntR family transcriptional regulator
MSDEPVLWSGEELSPIRDKVYQFIKNAIIQGTYKSGERIIERELADKLNVSRTPIREALFRLESQGFVKTLPRKGVIVSKLTPMEIIEIFTILSALESLTMKLASQKAEQSHRDELSRIIEEIEVALVKPNFDQADTKYHFRINDDVPGRLRKAMEEHRDLSIAVRNGEAELAEILTKIHVENAKKAYMEALERN